MLIWVFVNWTEHVNRHDFLFVIRYICCIEISINVIVHLTVIIEHFVFCLLLMVQAAKLIANLIVMGSGIMARAFVQAYRQALASKLYNLHY